MSNVALLRRTDQSEGSPEIRDNTGFDLPRIEQAVREILFALGEDAGRDGLIETPKEAPVGIKELFVATSRAALAIAVILLLIASTPRSGTAAEIEGVQFADQYQRDDVTLALHCVGLLRYKVLFKGYVAGLYLDPGVATEDALADVPKRLELSYFWGIKGSDFGKAGDEILARNVDPDTLARLRPRLERINALYETVKPGDRYALTYVPGLGTELALNGRSKGIIPGADFAAAYFRIWLGDQSIDTALRDQLLTCRKAA